MPELPEVEIVKRQLEMQLSLPASIKSIQFSEFNLRNPSPRKQKKHFENQLITGISRRSKYLLFHFQSGDGFLSHLGMTGRWRLQPSQEALQKHDHVMIDLQGERRLIYNDPRRFGYFTVLKKDQIHPLLKKLGPEPLTDDFEESSFFKKLKIRQSPIKNVIMDAQVVVGVGNIYASESLYRAGISPLKKSSKLNLQNVKKLMSEIRQVLSEAIVSGGSTIDDYRDVNGDAGGFQKKFYVYGREGQPCLRCESKIKKKNLAGRSTFWCSKCQSGK